MEQDKLQRLTEELVETEIRIAFEEFRSIAYKVHRGFLTMDGFKMLMTEKFYVHFYDFFKNHGFRMNISNKSWQRFLEDYDCFIHHKSLESTVGESWFFYDNLDDNFEDKGLLGIARSMRQYGEIPDMETEASSQDKAQFFRLMMEFQITTAYFEPIPEGIVRPTKHNTHSYNKVSTWVIDFNCINDGGLLAEEKPIGKTFTLINDLGLKAVVTIKEDRRDQNCNALDRDQFWPLGIYLAEGYVEGYTAIEQERNYPDIVIRASIENEKVQINMLGIMMDAIDQKAYYQFPLWQEYFYDYFSKDEKNDETLSAFFNTFL